MITSTPSGPPEPELRSRWNTPLNLGLLAAAAVLLALAAVLGTQVISFHHKTVALHAAAVRAKPVTKEAANDSLPPKGKAVVTISGSGTRNSRVHPLDYTWTGAWSADCRDEPGAQQLRITLLSAAGAQVASYSFQVRGYQSGRMTGTRIPSGYFQVSSACDWSLAVVDQEFPSP